MSSNWSAKHPLEGGGLTRSEVEAKKERGRLADRKLAASSAGRARRRV